MSRRYATSWPHADHRGTPGADHTRVTEIRQALGTQITEVRHELTNQGKEVRHALGTQVTEIRHELTNQVTEVRQELTEQTNDMRSLPSRSAAYTRSKRLHYRPYVEN